jgi:hypothetical protein
VSGPTQHPKTDKPDPLLGPAAKKPQVGSSSGSAAEEMLKQFFHRKP